MCQGMGAQRDWLLGPGRSLSAVCVQTNLYQQQPVASGSQMSSCLQLVSLESRHNY